MDAISQTFSNAFAWIKLYECRLRFHWILFLMFDLTIFRHWFRKWLGADQATSHYLNQWLLVCRLVYASLGLSFICFTVPTWNKVFLLLLFLLLLSELYVRVDPVRPSGTYMCRRTRSSFVHAMVCRLFGTKPWPEPMLTYTTTQRTYRNAILFWIQKFSFKKMHVKFCLCLSKLSTFVQKDHQETGLTHFSCVRAKMDFSELHRNWSFPWDDDERSWSAMRGRWYTYISINHVDTAGFIGVVDLWDITTDSIKSLSKLLEDMCGEVVRQAGP